MIQLKALFSLILIVVVVALACASSHSQSNMTGAFYNKPDELKLERSIKKAFRSYFRRPEFSGYYRLRPGDQLVPESFYPIGWSKDGKFAYFFEPDIGEGDSYAAKLLILDLKSDKAVWSFDYKTDPFSESLEEAKQGGKPHDFDTLWKANQQVFSDKLREHGIATQANFSQLAFPIRYQGERLTASLRTRQKPGLTEDERPYGIVGRTTLQLTLGRNASKTIFDHSYSESLPLHVGLVGYFKSPFEPRIAVVLIEVYRGWEGPPHTGHVKLVGASLEENFK